MRFKNLQFGTEPVVLHANGGVGMPVLERALAKLLREPARPRRRGAAVTVLTYNNSGADTPVERSLRHLGVPVRVLGRGIPASRWRNPAKIALTLKELDAVRTPFVMTVDSFDAVVLEDPSVAVERFERGFDCELLYSAEKKSYPDDPALTRFEKALPEARGTPFKFLNAGAMIGRTGYLKKALARLTREIDVMEFASEQLLIRWLYQRRYPEIKIDARCRIFQTLCRCSARDFSF